ncbi:diacylglycerol/lipid kinase family protein [Croceibacterium aestuarii]|uniref:diacylglycerol/lipid kinase family protein n=1 Tax=Croceibacterium aestuarii TaxID=3064139 RepID=UPI00272EABDF|nr:diacylglycerol kinase family protein [Croceibacterium sp. D39]
MSDGIKTFDELPRPAPGSSAAAGDARSTPRAVPLVGVIRNRRSYRNRGREQGAAPGADVIVETTTKRRELFGVLDSFAAKGVDYLAISGGDGTVRDVLTCGAAIFGDDWPTLIVLPKGKTNALAADIGAPDHWSLASAMESARAGRSVTRCPLIVSEAADPQSRVQGFLLGGGVFHRTIRLGQDAHRWGAFNAAAVGLTAAWALGQALLAGNDNPWRQRSLLRITLPGNEPLPGGDQRYVMIASTLENFPLGLKPFGDLREGLKASVLDTAARRSLLRLPLVAIGRRNRESGYHCFAADCFGFETDEPFILDGEAFPPGNYRVSTGPSLTFVAP